MLKKIKGAWLYINNDKSVFNCKKKKYLFIKL